MMQNAFVLNYHLALLMQHYKHLFSALNREKVAFKLNIMPLNHCRCTYSEYGGMELDIHSCQCSGSIMTEVWWDLVSLCYGLRWP